MQARRIVLATAAGALIATAQASAAEPDPSTLQQEVQTLEGMVLELQLRVSQLEAHAADSPQPATTAPQATPAAVQVAPVAATVPNAAQMEAPAPVVPAGSSYMSPEAALKSNWSNVMEGVDQEEVTRLLGAPSMKTTLDGRTVWYYTYPGTGRGSVFFTDAGKVSSRQSPFGLGW